MGRKKGDPYQVRRKDQAGENKVRVAFSDWRSRNIAQLYWFTFRAAMIGSGMSKHEANVREKVTFDMTKLNWLFIRCCRMLLKKSWNVLTWKECFPRGMALSCNNKKLSLRWVYQWWSPQQTHHWERYAPFVLACKLLTSWVFKETTEDNTGPRWASNILRWGGVSLFWRQNCKCLWPVLIQCICMPIFEISCILQSCFDLWTWQETITSKRLITLHDE